MVAYTPSLPRQMDISPQPLDISYNPLALPDETSSTSVRDFICLSGRQIRIFGAAADLGILHEFVAPTPVCAKPAEASESGSFWKAVRTGLKHHGLEITDSLQQFHVQDAFWPSNVGIYIRNLRELGRFDLRELEDLATDIRQGSLSVDAARLILFRLGQETEAPLRLCVLWEDDSGHDELNWCFKAWPPLFDQGKVPEDKWKSIVLGRTTTYGEEDGLTTLPVWFAVADDSSPTKRTFMARNTPTPDAMTALEHRPPAKKMAKLDSPTAVIPAAKTSGGSMIRRVTQKTAEFTKKGADITQKGAGKMATKVFNSKAAQLDKKIAALPAMIQKHQQQLATANSVLNGIQTSRHPTYGFGQVLDLNEVEYKQVFPEFVWKYMENSKKELDINFNTNADLVSQETPTVDNSMLIQTAGEITDVCVVASAEERPRLCPRHQGRLSRPLRHLCPVPGPDDR